MTDLAGAITSAARTAWWIVVVRGLLAVVLGIVALVWPGPTARVIIVLFGVWALVDGIIALVSIITGGGRSWGWLLLEGVLGIAAGIIAFRAPVTVALALVLLIAFWSIMIGVLEISGSLQVRQVPGSGWGWLLASGVVSIVFGILLFVWPDLGFATLIILIGIYALALGVVWLITAFMIRKDLKALA
ncbi:HdeD family acid-resistance protein [Mumia sp. zg.B17]|uniref:HdeD family acid-resistance protein n=1 Tax=unclassified Mumia TaxID=2621872 RepID=UPI001C6DF57A|nr:MULTISPECIES: HdeD family acid-resistance protein [unclassified Mumia]MBW9207667.1 HdeD family acid-resistance protein [Mumia sp. zg.B17]MDD9347792.1 HdeD family acid-resistance protein [Mumia sp.]